MFEACLFVVSCVILTRLCIEVETCTTPNGEAGKCIPLSSCPALLWSFTNPKKGTEASTRKFICSEGGDSGYMVCCPKSSSTLIVEDNGANMKVKNNTDLYNLKHCGLQRLQTYPSTEGTTSVDEFPWLVGIMTRDSSMPNADYEDGIEQIVCTGTLINARYLITSARCLDDSKGPTITFFVRVEEYRPHNETVCPIFTSYYKWDCGKYSDYEIEEIIMHPFYNTRTFFNDIAILRLNRFVPFTGFIRPICLPLEGTNTARPGDILALSGWTDSSDDVWSVKNKVYTKLITHTNCNLIFKILNQTVTLTPFEMCTIKSPTAINVTCDDYYGNPIMFSDNNRWHLEGISSWGANCTNRVPAVHTRIDNYLMWIQENVRDEKCTTPHGEVGECKYLKECPRLLNAFTNLKENAEDYLSGFICPHKEEYEDLDTYTILVCCGTSSNFTLLNKSNSAAVVTDSRLGSTLNNREYCGFQHKDDYFSPSNSISIDEFPWLAAIYNNTNETDYKRGIVCSGTLISYKYVLTGSRCLSMFEDNDTITVRLGEYHVKNDTDCIELPQFASTDCSTVEEYDVEEKIMHPFFDKFTYLNDVALLRLSKPAMFSDYIRPICLPLPDVTYVRPGDKLYTTGWGENSDYDEGEIEIKKKIVTTLVTNEECLKNLTKIYGTTVAVTEHQLCTKDERNGTEFLCYGDTGGPIMVSYKHQWYIEGISSNIACKFDEPQVHTKVSKYLEWIKRHVRP